MSAIDAARRRVATFARSGPGIVTGIWAVSRVAAYIAGVGFDSRLLPIAQHLLDVDLLRHDPFTSILYLHSQPPLFNVVTAVFLQLPHSLVTPGLSLAWHASGLLTALVTYRVMVRVGIRTWLAVVVVGLFVLSPTAILFESWFFYSQLQMLLVALVLLGAARFAEHRRVADGLLLTGAFAALVLLRSLYPVWLMVAFVALVWLLLRLDVRKVLAVAAVPLVVALAWNVKNEVIFGRFGSSSWQGMSLWRVALAGVPGEEITALHRQGEIDALSKLPSFGGPSLYRGAVTSDHYGVAATDRLFKHNGAVNFNAALYLKVSDRFQHDALTALWHDGIHGIARAEVAAYALWNQSGDSYLYRNPDFRALGAYGSWFDRVVLLHYQGSSYSDPLRFALNSPTRLHHSLLVEILESVSPTVLALQLLAVVGGVIGWRRGRAKRDVVMVTVVATTLLVFVWTMVVSNLAEFGENARFRTEIWPAIIVPAALALEFAIQHRARRRAQASLPTTPRAQLSQKET